MIKAEMGLDIGGLQKGLDDAKTAIGKFAKQAATVGGPLSEVGGTISGSFSKMSQVAAAAATPIGAAVVGIAAAAAVAGAGIKGMMDSVARGKELTMLAEQTSTTVPQLMKLEKVFGRVGVSMEELPAMMAKFNGAMGDIGDPSSKAAMALAKVGISAQDFQGKDYYESLKLVAGGMDRAASATDRMTVASALFGARKGNLLLPAMKGEVFAQVERKANPVAQIYEDFGPVFGQFQYLIKRFSVSLDPFFAAMASYIIPNLVGVAAKFESIAPMLVDAGLQIGEGLAVGALLLGKVVDNLSQNSDALKKSFSIAASFAIGDFVGAMQKMMPEAAGGGEKKSGFFDDLIAEVNKVRDSFKKPEGGLNTVDTGINKLTQAPGMIADSLAKVGGGGGVFSSAANDIDIQRDQLRMQTRMATALEAFVQKFQAESNPYLGMTPGAGTTA
jgi:hypothetical protein